MCNVNLNSTEELLEHFFPITNFLQVKEAKVSTAKIMALFTFCVKAVFFLKEEISFGLQLKRGPLDYFIT